MTSRNMLTWMAGADPDVLKKAPTDRIKFSAMGGVLLTTAGVAALSAAFALNTAVGLSGPAAGVIGALWGVAIFNLDRMLIVSMVKQSGWWRNLVTVVARLLLAAVIGTVISTPMVLKIFESEINGELQVMHSDNLIASQQKLKEQYADVDPMQQKVDQLQAIAAGQAQQVNVSSNADVQAAQAKVDTAQKAYDEAAQAAQCELVGSCGTNRPGVGTAFRESKQREQDAKAALDDAKRELDSVSTQVRSQIANGSTTARADAQRELDTLRPILERRIAERNDAQGRLDRGEEGSEGILARLEALDRLSAGHPTMHLAHWALFLLFLLIEVLPVLVKSLAVFGGETAYDRELSRHERLLEKRATARDDVYQQLEDDRMIGQVNAGKLANAKLVEKQAEIAARAIDVWGVLASSRSEKELADWYARHSGGAPMPPLPAAPAPAGGPSPANGGGGAATTPGSAPTRPLPIPAPAPAPAATPTAANSANGGATATTAPATTVPMPASAATTVTAPTPIPTVPMPRSAQSYQQFRATHSAPQPVPTSSVNGHSYGNTSSSSEV